MHYKFLKKIIGAIGFKLIPKNFIKNDRLLSEFSCLSLKKILKGLFVNNEIKSIIQIGANDGLRFDDLNSFVKKYTPYGIFVEPINPGVYDETRAIKKITVNHKITFEITDFNKDTGECSAIGKIE